MKQIFVINKDLKMDKGKAAVQVAHSETYYMDKILQIFCKDILSRTDGVLGVVMEKPTLSEINLIDSYDKWFNTHMKKIVLKATEQEIIEFETNLKEKGIWTHRVYDLGLTQVPKNSFTCLVVEPLEQSFKQFKLL